jgi:PTS system mannose-specific IIA component
MTKDGGKTSIGLVLVTHGNLALELRSVMEHVVGPQEAVVTVCIGPDDDMEQRRQDILRGVKEVDTGAGAIVLTDMFGGTPSNLAISIMEQAPIEVIAGVNLPMLVKLASARENSDIASAATAAQNAGQKYIRIASQVLSGKD